MNEEQANAVYDILVADCGAFEDERLPFVFEMKRGCREYRCCHALGFGGKFYPAEMQEVPAHVDYYAEDSTHKRDIIRVNTDEKLRKLAESWRLESVTDDAKAS